jgi:nucleotide-binding universal stress UspA family protein
MACKILLPVDGSDGSAGAARHLADMARHVTALEVHLVNVQPPGDDWMVRRMLKATELARMEAEWAESALAPARQILQQAGVRHAEHTVQGEVAPTLVRLADELGCDQIVMGTHGLSALGDLVMGSVAHKVLHLTRLPVTLVK